ncbi:hypothetical protein BOO86_08725 [Mycobacterium sp. CBMA 234]|nr:hypothetical protein [Mycolicibacterium sp. CBMA 234]
MCLVLLAFTTASVSMAPVAVADSVDTLRAALVAARAVSCGPLQSDPRVERTALEVNESTDKWINHDARTEPEADALPRLKDLGYGGSKAAILYGAGATAADSIKVVLLQGYRDIPDCSYTNYGVSALHNASTGRILTTIVLAG